MGIEDEAFYTLESREFNIKIKNSRFKMRKNCIIIRINRIINKNYGISNASWSNIFYESIYYIVINVNIVY